MAHDRESIILEFSEDFLPVLFPVVRAPVLRKALLVNSCTYALANGFPIPGFCEVIVLEQLSSTRMRATIETEHPGDEP